ncbi:MAG: DUF4873 domain-containing protein, partial [Pseudonocardia sp.]|nr:DUF4873 domain-containing protein [Pseudonocardia sp.]
MAEQPATRIAGQDEDHDDEGYTGPATVVLDGEQIPVQVRLECRLEPFDGKVHWSGRVLVNARLTELIGNGSAEVELRTGGHSAPGKLAEPDMWQRYRATGVGHPPFAMDDPPESD